MLKEIGTHSIKEFIFTHSVIIAIAITSLIAAGVYIYG